MTRRRSVNRNAIKNLNDNILTALQAGPQTADRLSTTLGVASSTIRGRLHEMSEDGYVYVVKDYPMGKLGARYTWHLGEGEHFNRSIPRERLPITSPRQSCVSTYPIIGRRDALQEAFFGPARKEVA